MDELLKNIEMSYVVVGESIKGFSKQMAHGARKFKKRITPRWLRLQGERQTVRRANFHENYKRFLGFYYEAGNIAGAEMIIQDLELFVRELRVVYCGALRSLLPAQAAAELMLIRNRCDLMLAGI